MSIIFQCAYCGEFLTMCAAQIYAGNLACPFCHELGIIIPETEVTPRPGPFHVEEDFKLFRLGKDE